MLHILIAERGVAGHEKAGRRNDEMEQAENPSHGANYYSLASRQTMPAGLANTRLINAQNSQRTGPGVDDENAPRDSCYPAWTVPLLARPEPRFQLLGRAIFTLGNEGPGVR